MTTESAPDVEPRKRRGFLYFLRDVIVIIVIAALVSFLVKTFVVRSFFIPSGSMERTLLIDDRILVDELTPNWNGYERGDVVVFQDPGGWLPTQPPAPEQSAIGAAIDSVLTFVGVSASDSQDHLVKRLIGLPGDHVVCCNALGQITINGTPVNEEYLNLPNPDAAVSDPGFDVTVPEDSVWVLGDNRYSSQDSRAHQELPSGGFVPMENIVGRAFLTTWPFDRVGMIDSHHEAFDAIPDAQ